MGHRYIGLVRVSTERQGESCLGLEAGLKDLHDYVAIHGGELVEVLEEVESGCARKAWGRGKRCNAETFRWNLAGHQPPPGRAWPAAGSESCVVFG
jgi:hypothetical protein